MLKIHVEVGRLHQWVWDSGRWRSGDSWVEPVANPALEHAMVTDGLSALVLVRERARVRSPLRFAGDTVTSVGSGTFEALLSEVRGWPLEFAALKIGPGSVRLHAGKWGTAPLYLAAGGDTLDASWDLIDLREHMNADLLDDREITRLLVRRHRYSRSTISDVITQLTERATAEFSFHGGLVVRYPDPGTHYRPRQLHADAPVLDVYEGLLDQAIAQWAVQPEGVAVELSGGMDSAMVALSLAHRHPGQITSYGLVVDGEAGIQQRRRRTALVRHAKLNDLTVSALRWAPFDPDGVRGQGGVWNPSDEPYSEALHAIVLAAGRRVVFTGIGGDELLALRPDERNESTATTHSQPSWLGPRVRELLAVLDEDLAPVSAIYETALMAASCRSTVFLRAGCWPVSPLCSPELVRFGQWLPRQWRIGKQLPRARLARLAFSEDVVQPVLPENFAGVMQHGLRRHGLGLLAGIVGNSMLVDLGYVDGAALRAAYDTALTSEIIDTTLYEVIAMEIGLRTLLGQGGDLTARRLPTGGSPR
ncbi:MAG: asparagine synthase-related protein [Pseudonocardiales bacterium]